MSYLQDTTNLSRGERTHKFETNNERLLKALTQNLNKGNAFGFLRECISNSSDAHDKRKQLIDLQFKELSDYHEKMCKPKNKKYDKQKVQAIEDNDEDYESDEEENKVPNMIYTEREPFINVFCDYGEQKLIISDNGIGMSYEDLVNNIGVIASSGTNTFSQDNNLKGMIGQFGLGFYSVFVVSDNVEIVTTTYDDKRELITYSWKYVGGDDYTISKLGVTYSHPGTSVILKIKDEYLEIMKEEALIANVQKYCFYVKYPINILRFRIFKKKDPKPYLDQMNCLEMPIWRKPKSTLTTQDYIKYYHENFVREIIGDRPSKDPLTYIHKKYKMNGSKGEINVSYLLYIPPFANSDLGEEDIEEGHKIKLYSEGILIDDIGSDYFPQWMSFAQGIVEINNLQLNITRQSHLDKKLVFDVKKKITEDFIQIVEDYKSKGRTHLELLNREYSSCFKIGIAEELSDRKTQREDITGIEHAKRMFNLLLWDTSKNRRICFDEYVADMQEDQIGIYYLAGGDKHILMNSPFIEKIILFENDSEEERLKKKDYEILFFTENIDEQIKNYLVGYKKNENIMIVGIEDETNTNSEENETTLKIYDDVDLEDFNTKRFIDTARGELIVDFNKDEYLSEEQSTELIIKLKNIYGKTLGIELHDIKVCDKFHTTPAVVVSQVNITAQFENQLQNKMFKNKHDQYTNILKRKNLLISPSNEQIKILYRLIVQQRLGGNNNNIRKLLTKIYDIAMMIGGYQALDYVSLARDNFYYIGKDLTSLEKKVNKIKLN